MSVDTPTLKVDAVSKTFPLPRKTFWGSARGLSAVSDVSLVVKAGQTLSIVGESGCGKSTLGRIVVGLTAPDCGDVAIDGVNRTVAGKDERRDLLRKVQLIFQDPYGSLSPRRTVAQILSEPLRNFGLADSTDALGRRVAELLEKVRLPASAAQRLPHEFSGGQRQRIAIARALATSPSLIVCDEAVSALDVSVKAQIVNLLVDLQQSEKLALLFISHDLAIVQHLTHEVAVMYLGRIVESGSRQDVFLNPKHPYTRALMSAVPIPDVGSKRTRIVLKGDVPDPASAPAGCPFSGRCPIAEPRCRSERPELRPVGHETRKVACHFADSTPLN